LKKQAQGKRSTRNWPFNASGIRYYKKKPYCVTIRLLLVTQE
jgi:hypothetical protein